MVLLIQRPLHWQKERWTNSFDIWNSRRIKAFLFCFPVSQIFWFPTHPHFHKMVDSVSNRPMLPALPRGISETQIHKYKRNTNVNIPKTVAFVSIQCYLPRPDVHILTYDLCWRLRFKLDGLWQQSRYVLNIPFVNRTHILGEYKQWETTTFMLILFHQAI